MAKKTHVKVRMVPEAKPDSPFFYYVKKPAGGEKAKVKLKARKIIQAPENMKFLWRKNCLHIANSLFFFKVSFLVVYIRPNHIFPNSIGDFRVYLFLN